jgi:phosphoribosylglycinamide formyltransferase 1
MNKLALFASGTGSNVLNIIQYFKNHSSIQVDSVVSNKATAGALIHAQDNNIESFAFTKNDFEGYTVLDLLKSRGVTHIILAGFLLKIPSSFIQAYSDKIINIHPSLLPKYGGKGMYGMHVHNAVIANQEKESGITIHLVNEIYDGGEILAQFKVNLDSNDTPSDVALKVQKLEQIHFPYIIEKFILQTK